MITPSFGLTATERVLPKLALDFTTATLDPRITFTRALNTATRVNASGNIEVVNADVARFDYDPSTLVCKGLLIEESRVNSIRNNTMQGAVAGTPGTLPTNWSLAVNTTTGLTTSVVGTGTESGIDYVDIRLQGTSSGAGSFNVYFEQNGVITAAVSQAWSGSIYWKVAAGSMTGISGGALRYDERAAGFLANKTLASGTPTTASLISQKISGSATTTNASTTNLSPYIRFTIADATAIDLTLRIGLPQLELGAFSTSVIKTSTAAVTRNADVATMTGTNFSSWFNATQGTIFIKANYSSLSASFPMFCSVNDGTTGNSMSIFKNTSGSNQILYNGSDTSAQWNLTPTTASANAFFNLAAAFKLNDIAASGNAGAVVTDTSATIPTVNKLDIGNRAGALFLNGIIQKLNFYPIRLLNAELQAVTS